PYDNRPAPQSSWSRLADSGLAFPWRMRRIMTEHGAHNARRRREGVHQREFSPPSLLTTLVVFAGCAVFNNRSARIASTYGELIHRSRQAGLWSDSRSLQIRSCNSVANPGLFTIA